MEDRFITGILSNNYFLQVWLEALQFA